MRYINPRFTYLLTYSELRDVSDVTCHYNIWDHTVLPATRTFRSRLGLEILTYRSRLMLGTINFIYIPAQYGDKTPACLTLYRLDGDEADKLSAGYCEERHVKSSQDACIIHVVTCG